MEWDAFLPALVTKKFGFVTLTREILRPSPLLSAIKSTLTLIAMFPNGPARRACVCANHISGIILHVDLLL
jgi:hypothetical protein